MVEVIYNKSDNEGKESKESIVLPKNIRQIGTPGEEKKIYVEDYVITYINQLALQSPQKQRAAILLGKCETIEKEVFLFIYGAVAVEHVEIQDDNLCFNHTMWEEIYEQIKKYFHELSIIGWFLTRPGKMIGVTDKIRKIHVDNFPGMEKALFVMDPTDKEEAFYIYEEGALIKQQGYYIYYERNEEMQNYIIAQGKERFPVKEQFKAIDHEKKETFPEPGRIKKTYGVTAALAAAIITLGVVLYTQVISRPVETGSHQVTMETKESVTNPKDDTAMQEDDSKAAVADLTNDTTAASKTFTGTRRYTVQNGDTLAGICMTIYQDQSYVDKVCELNGISDAHWIYPGMVLTLP